MSGAPFAAAAASATALLSGWAPDDAGDDARRRLYLDHLARRGPAALDRGAGGVHLTASCVVLDASRARTLLVLHAKAGVWVQPGGHVEAGDASLAAAAAREVVEETGLDDLALGALRLGDLSHHGLGAAFGACAEHLDVTFVAVLDGVDGDDGADGALRASSESDAVAWWPVADVVAGRAPEGVVADLPGRLARLAARPQRPRPPTSR